jgi:hypothetical protein
MSYAVEPPDALPSDERPKTKDRNWSFVFRPKFVNCVSSILIKIGAEGVKETKGTKSF